MRRIAGDVDGQGNQWHHGTQPYCDMTGHLWIARSERWAFNQQGQLVTCQRRAAMEYRYDSGGARYMVRPRDPQTLEVPTEGENGWTLWESGGWRDYDGDWISGDYAVTLTPDEHGLPTDATVERLTYNGRRPDRAAIRLAGRGAHVKAKPLLVQEPGMAQYRHATGQAAYLLGNLIGTTEVMTDAAGAAVHRAVYTAFGQPVHLAGTGVPPAGTRYGYAGAWGYKSGTWDPDCPEADPSACDPLAALGWLHVGERYYDLASGRFMQRDPIGIAGGLNVYLYCFNNPVNCIDPLGLCAGPDLPWWMWLTGGRHSWLDGWTRDHPLI